MIKSRAGLESLLRMALLGLLVMVCQCCMGLLNGTGFVVVSTDTKSISLVPLERVEKLGRGQG